MKERTQQLIRSRNGASNNYNGCPVHVSLDACAALFREAGANPSPSAVGTLGDVLENYALMLLKGSRGKSVSEQDLAQLVDSIG